MAWRMSRTRRERWGASFLRSFRGALPGMSRVDEELPGAVRALAVDDVMPFLELRKHGAKQFGWVLQIGVENEYNFSAAKLEARGQRDLVAVIARQVDADNVRVLACMASDDRPGRVARTVVHQDDLEIVGHQGLAHGHEAADELVQSGLLIIAGNDHRKSRSFRIS